MSGSADTAARRPWYKQVWPWLLMLPPGLSIAGGVAMVYLAAHTPSALVVEDYARIEELTSERFARDREAMRLALIAELDFGRDPGRIEVALRAPESFELPEALTLILRHATNPAADRNLRLVRRGSVFVVDAERVPGRYLLELEPPDRSWRLGAGAQRLEGRVILRPQREGA